MSIADQLDAYFEAGEKRAQQLDNRGPLRFDDEGKLHPDILEAYREFGFYIFQGVIGQQELTELESGLADLLERTPESEEDTVDRLGRPLEPGLPSLQWAQALSDPWGGTRLLNGRHPVAMDLPELKSDKPEKTIFLMLGLFESMPSALRLSAHPGMLRVAEAVHGSDFVPYNDSIFMKEAGLGAAVAWHQDGTTHWGSEHWDSEVHGANFMAQLERTTAANGLWVLPGSHQLGHIDIPRLVSENGDSTLLSDAVPMLCEKGDIAICNRQCLHGSFANASADPRVSLVWGFFRRDAVLGAEVDMPATREEQAPVRRQYTEEDIKERAGIVQLAIEARAAQYPDEVPYQYSPCASEAGNYADEIVRAEALRGYRQGTIFI